MNKRVGLMALAAAGAVAFAGTARATDIGVTGIKLIILDKSPSFKAVSVSKDGGIAKGAGTDPALVEGSMDVKYDAAAGEWLMPQGSNWLTNNASIAKYINAAAPTGGSVKVGKVKPATLFKVVAKSLGETAIDISAAPTGSVYVAMNVTNGGSEFRHCMEYPLGSCAHKVLTGGYKLVCKTAIPDPTCAAAEPPPSGTTLEFVTTAGAGDCGDVRMGGAGGTLLQNLDCGKLYLGAGDSTLAGGLTPSGSLTVFNSACASGTCTLSATTAGAVGANHCTSAATVTATACLGQAVGNVTCTGPHGATATCAADGFCHIPTCKFGTRLPIVNGPLSTCVTNSFRSAGGGSVSSGSGTGSMNIDLWSQPTVTGNLAAPCPLCSGAPGVGTCSAVAFNPGAACTGTNATGNNYECVAGNVVTGSIPEFQVNLGAVSTSGASASGPSFCPGQVTAGAFGWGGTGGNTTVADYIAVTGSAAGTLSPGTHAVGLGSTFCIPATGNVLVDGSTDLPGPGAVSLVGTWELVP